MTTAAPDAFLDMFRNHPTLLPLAPDPITPADVKARIAECLPCQRCGYTVIGEHQPSAGDDRC